MDAIFPNIRHLRVLCEAARLGSVSLAAEQVHLSQPAATQAIARMESDLGVTLLARHRDGLVPTPLGTVFLDRARRALDQLAMGARVAVRLAGPGGATRQARFDTKVTAAQLRALVAIAGSGSFTIAARDLGLSQPTVHKTARTLEALAGFRLFASGAAGVELSPAAQALVQRVKLAYAEIRQGLDEIDAALSRESATFVLGSLPLARTHIVPKAVNAMIRATPRLQIRVVDGRYSELLRSLREGEIDCLIGALRGPALVGDVVQEALFDDPLAIVAGRDHPLAGRAEVSLEDTLQYPWVAPPRQAPAGQYLYETLRIQDRPETPVRVVSSSLVFLRGLLGEGDFLTVISRHQISREEAAGTLVSLPVPLQGNRRPIGLTWRRDWRPTATQARFMDLLREWSLHETGTAADEKAIL